MTTEFPKNFFWGAASSATQSEGREPHDGKGENIWDYSSKEFNFRFYDGVTTEHTSYFYQDYKEDIQRMKEIGFNSFRTSISWSRLFPDGVGELNQKGVDFYNQMIDELLAQGIEPFINLYHFDMPIKLQEIGGFENREVIQAYADYARTCFELFGDRVNYWFTFNEPMIPAEAGYLHDRHYPYVVDFKRAAAVLHHIVLAHCEAVKIYREMKLSGKIGIIMDVIPVYPRSQHPADLEAAEMADLFYTKSINDAILKGKYPDKLKSVLLEYDQLPEVTTTDTALIASTKIDLLGINYYRPRRVKAKECLPNPQGVFSPEWFFDNYEMPGRRMNTSRGIEIYPKGIYDIAKKIQNEYGNIDWFVSENGIGIQEEEQFMENGIVQDDYRIDFLKEHLTYLNLAMKEGANCLGYHMWTFVDCWSWGNAYKNRYGFYRLDTETGEKTCKKSGHWFKKLTENHGFE
ncbi:glycoside hydrolase family 1 protein [Enterococcus sp. BWR-S5]|uniref:glycoside hydrolase family 1 protein n=1 Tax=Enterococcus sp. BWR-S5 TaxID=2787714 RepID=UPI001924C805|nr:glycoside hydrolase family 1 protein [Enterococcus sp. BWR-S5]MBL1225068.1 glycoside hydrolase family 1 protein [Enterococcus sp. BWR-S5]